MPPLTIVMYHYVRPLSRSFYPSIKGLDLEQFNLQLDYVQRYYNPVSMENVLDALDGGSSLPVLPVLLTFDDGYIDHFSYVFPILQKRQLKGVFFPPSDAILNRRMLDVNKIHFLLASGAAPNNISADIDAGIVRHASEFELNDLQFYREKYFRPGRYDEPTVAYIKALLQHALPENLRAELVAQLFWKHVGADEETFAEGLYMTPGQLRVMVSAGHHIGSHGTAHYWLGRLAPEAQRKDVEQSLELLDAAGMSHDSRTICYPYGDYNAATLSIVESLKFRAGVTTRPDLAHLDSDGRLELPRLDTNDLPRAATAEVADWTKRANGLL